MPIRPLTKDAIHITTSASSLHPHLQIRVNSSSSSTSTSAQTSSNGDTSPCLVHLRLEFPDALFIDRDEVREVWPNPQILAWDIQPDTVDIERPVRLKEKGVQLDLILAQQGEEALDVPLHARYLEPDEKGTREIAIFGDGSGGVRAGLRCGMDALLIDEISADLPLVDVGPVTVSLPTGKLSHQPLVESLTTIAIWLGFAWLVYKVIRLGRRMDRRGPSRTKVKTT